MCDLAHTMQKTNLSMYVRQEQQTPADFHLRT